MTIENEKVAQQQQQQKQIILNKFSFNRRSNSLNYQFKLWIARWSCNEQYILKY